MAGMTRNPSRGQPFKITENGTILSIVTAVAVKQSRKGQSCRWRIPAALVAPARALCQGRAVNLSGPPHVVVVGGGIAGLAAAFFLREAPCRVTVLEGLPRLGG